MARTGHPAPKRRRMTRQRRIILEELRAAGGHPTADELHQRVRQRLPRISLATVYRNLDVLAEAGEIVTVRLAGGQRRFDAVLDRHYHVRCVECGKVRDVPAEPFGDIGEAARRVCDFEVLGYELQIDGLCPSCAAARRGEQKQG